MKSRGRTRRGRMMAIRKSPFDWWVMTKTCFKCNRTLDVECFYRHPRMTDGRLGKCKECTRGDVQANYRRNRKHYEQYEHIRNKKEKRREDKKEYQRRSRMKDNRLRDNARMKTLRAIASGRLKRLECEICGNPKTEAHHADYTRPLDVQWLCRKHHLEQHGKMAFELKAG